VPEVRFTRLAAQDLDDIWEYIAQDNEAAARDFIEKLISRIESLAEMPLAGPERPEIAAKVRILAIDRYVVLYRVAVASVEVLRVVHGSRDFMRLNLDE